MRYLPVDIEQTTINQVEVSVSYCDFKTAIQVNKQTNNKKDTKRYSGFCNDKNQSFPISGHLITSNKSGLSQEA